MNFDPFFAWVEQTAISIWVRESPSLWAFPTVLIFHAIGMGFVAGTSMILDLRALGYARQIPIPSLKSFLPVAWFGFAINAISGLLLLAAYPVKSLTNPLFYFKIACVAIAVVNLRLLSRRMFAEPPTSWDAPSAGVKRIAISSLVLWTLAIFAGRLLAYTYKRLMVNE